MTGNLAFGLLVIMMAILGGCSQPGIPADHAGDVVSRPVAPSVLYIPMHGPPQKNVTEHNLIRLPEAELVGVASVTIQVNVSIQRLVRYPASAQGMLGCELLIDKGGEALLVSPWNGFYNRRESDPGQAGRTNVFESRFRESVVVLPPYSGDLVVDVVMACSEERSGEAMGAHVVTAGPIHVLMMRGPQR